MATSGMSYLPQRRLMNKHILKLRSFSLFEAFVDGAYPERMG